MWIEVAGGKLNAVEGEREVRGKASQRLKMVIEKQPSIRGESFRGEGDHAGAEIQVPLPHCRRLGYAHPATVPFEICPT